MRTTLPLVILAAFSVTAAGQQFGSSTFIIGVGGAFPGGESAGAFHKGVAVTGEYEFGLHKFLAANVGLENLLLELNNVDRFGIFVTRERIALVPFGLRVILPVRRSEFFVGTGGAHIGGSAFDSISLDKGVLWHVNAGFRVALDRASRIRVGTTVRQYRDLGRPTQIWTSLSGDISFRFGR